MRFSDFTAGTVRRKQIVPAAKCAGIDASGIAREVLPCSERSDAKQPGLQSTGLFAPHAEPRRDVSEANRRIAAAFRPGMSAHTGLALYRSAPLLGVRDFVSFPLYQFR